MSANIAIVNGFIVNETQLWKIVNVNTPMPDDDDFEFGDWFCNEIQSSVNINGEVYSVGYLYSPLVNDSGPFGELVSTLREKVDADKEVDKEVEKEVEDDSEYEPVQLYWIGHLVSRLSLSTRSLDENLGTSIVDSLKNPPKNPPGILEYPMFFQVYDNGC